MIQNGWTSRVFSFSTPTIFIVNETLGFACCNFFGLLAKSSKCRFLPFAMVTFAINGLVALFISLNRSFPNLFWTVSFCQPWNRCISRYWFARFLSLFYCSFVKCSSERRPDTGQTVGCPCKKSTYGLRKLGWLELIILCIFLLYFLLFQHMLQTHKHALFVARRLHLKVKFKRPRFRCLLRRETEKKTCAVILACHEI